MQTPTLFLKKILAETVKRNAESLHLAVGGFALLEIDGKFAALESEGLVTNEAMREIMLEHLSEEERSELMLNRELTSAKDFDAGARFKFNIYYQKDVPSMTFYPVPREIRNFTELNFSRATMDFFGKRSGLIVVAGAHGSGRTSTAASFIEHLNRGAEKRILTVEKPIEYVFVSKKCLIEQQEAGRDTRSFRSAFEYAFKEDFDVIYSGEHRSELPETLPILCELASGNALVLLELQAASALEAAGKLLSVSEGSRSEKAQRYALADALLCVICQRLVPRIGGGKALAHESLINNPTVKSFMREGRIFQAESVIQASRHEGMTTFKETLSDLADRGVIRREEAAAAAT